MLAEGQSAEQVDNYIRQDLSSITLDSGDLRDVVAKVASTARTALPSVWGLSLSAGDPDTSVRATHAEPEPVAELERLQHVRGSGVSLEALARNRPVTCTLEDLARRWPDLAAEAERHGVTTVIAIPVGVASQPVGVLTLYVTHPDVLELQPTESVARALAAHAAVILRNATLFAAAQARVAQLAEALETRETIAQAKGVIMARHDCDPDTAFELLRDISQRSHRKLRDVAAEVVTSMGAGARPYGITDDPPEGNDR